MARPLSPSRPVVSHSPFPGLLVIDAAHKQTIMRAESFTYAHATHQLPARLSESSPITESSTEAPHYQEMALHYIVPRLDNRSIEEFEVILRGSR
jgi:hypothetical protein